MRITQANLATFLATQAANLSSIAKIWRVALPPLEKIAYKLMVDRGDPVMWGPRHEREDKFHIASNLVRAVLKAYDRGSPAVRERLLNLFLRQFLTIDVNESAKAFETEHGLGPPGFFTISPGGECNLRCRDCYAASVPKGLPSLSAELVERVLREKYEKWGSWFTVISGGEPFVWRDGSVDIVEIAKRHPQQYFLVYTNGTLIDKGTAQRLAEVGNMTMAISVEGFEEQTDARRGKGTYRRILAAFEHLRDAGVPFGISVTATPENAELLISKQMIDFYFDQQGALYQWLFQYMPIGRGVDVARQVPPDMRRRMWFREQEIVRKERRFFADFWNSGTFSSGCIAGGRTGGYLYIDWNGNIYPCVFVPFWKDNIHDLFAQGKSLTDALFSDLFAGVRQWQRSYNYLCAPHCRGNEIRPCIIRDHHRTAHDLFVKTRAKPGYPSAALCLRDPEYRQAMIRYDDELARLLDPIWEKHYGEPLAQA
ncbi:MAG: radical SAM protein [Candidatus Eisenbacteria sp.]|nr:radical SAM protein [Candidatus Eisenbacteria bacterium]